MNATLDTFEQMAEQEEQLPERKTGLSTFFDIPKSHRATEEWYANTARSWGITPVEVMENYFNVYKNKINALNGSSDEEIVQNVKYDVLEKHIKIDSSQISEPDEVVMDFEDAKMLHKKEFDKILDISALPKDHFLREYVEISDMLSDSFIEFHVCTGLWLLSAMTQDKFFLKTEFGTIYPNLYITLLGRSSSGKSPSIEKSVEVFELCAQARLFNGDFSVEGLVQHVSLHPISHFVYDEAGSLYAKYHKHYNEGAIDYENKFYDRKTALKELVGKKNKDGTISPPASIVAQDMFVTHLYGLTISRFLEVYKYEDATTGNAFRNLYCHVTRRKEKIKYIEEETSEDVEKWGEFIKRAKRLYNLIKATKGDKVRFHATKEAWDYYHHEVQDKLHEIETKVDSEVQESADGKAKMHILKLAMLIEVGKKYDPAQDPYRDMTQKESRDLPYYTMIQLDSMKIAIDWVINYFLPMSLDIVNALKETDNKNPVLIVWNYMKKHGVVKHSKALGDTHLGSDSFNKAISTLMEAGKITTFKDKNSRAKCYQVIPENGGS